VQGCGYAEEVGKGPGGGFNVNVPWTAKGMGDADYLAAFDLLLKPIIAQFDPQVGPWSCIANAINCLDLLRSRLPGSL
jgi:acetoin utilization deacetylase AcuC-like enzyme